MDKMMLQNAGVDVEAGLARFHGNEAMYEKWLHRFPKETQYAELLAALKAGETQAAFEAAHALKGVSGNLSLVRLYDRVLPLVEALRAGKMAEAEPLLLPVMTEYTHVVDILQQPEG